MAKSSPIVLFFLAACLGTGVVPISPIASASKAQAQTTETQQTEAERLLNLCREHLSKNQAEAAIQSYQSAVIANSRVKIPLGLLTISSRISSHCEPIKISGISSPT